MPIFPVLYAVFLELPITIRIYSEVIQEGSFALINANSQRVVDYRQALRAGTNLIQLPLVNVSNGFYILQLQKGKEQLTRKIIVSK